MKKRIITALWGIPLVVLSIIFNNKPLPLFTILMLVIGVLSIKEFFNLSEKIDNIKPYKITGYIFTALMIIAAKYIPELRVLLLGLLTIITLIIMLKSEDFKSGVKNFVWTVAGVTYLGFVPSYLVSIGELINGNNIIIWTIITVFSIDIFAFFVGCKFGKHKFAPRVSPKKSVEGLIGGLAGSYLVGLLFNNILQLNFNIIGVIVLLTLMFVCAVFGDLIESYIKRAANVKDSSNLLQGHGGMMDRFDSLYLTGFIVYNFIVWFLI